MKNLALAAAFSLGLMASNAHALTRTDVINGLSQNVVLKTYQDLAQASVNLKTAVDTLIAQPTQTNLEIAQAKWRMARGAYEGSEGFLFGPIDSLGIDPMIDTWPLALGDMKAILASNQTLDSDFIHSLNSNVLGFHAIEFLLFGEGVKTNTKDVTTFTKREFDYLSGSTAILVEQTALLKYAWTTHSDPEDSNSAPYIDIFSKPGPANQTYSTEEAVVEQLAAGMIDILNEASTAKLPDATGTDIENANASLEESPFSWNSINDYTSNINSVLAIYTGDYGITQGPGIKDLVAQKNTTLANQVEAQILSSRTLIQNIKGPNNMSFGQAIKDQEGRARIFKAIDGLTTLKQMLETQVVPLLK